MAVPRNILALDVGERRIGVAIADMDSLLASPLKTILNDEQTFGEISKIVHENTIELIVVGLPRNLNGDDTAQTKFAREFAEDLNRSINIQIMFEDEALSSVRAREVLDHKAKPYKKEEIDALAAAFILEDYLANKERVS